MPPPQAVAGAYIAPDGRKIKVAPLTDEDRRTLVRWIDLGCPIDLQYDAADPGKVNQGWMLDDNRPTLALTYPVAGRNAELSRILVGMHDTGSGIDPGSFTVTADFDVDGVKAGTNLAEKFVEKSAGVRELKLATPLKKLERGTLTVSVKDNQGNTTRIVRTLAVGAVK